MTATDSATPAIPAAGGSTADPRVRAARTLALLVVLVAIAVLIFWFSCRHTPPEPPFDWFRYTADELGNDPQRALAFVRDEVATLPYRGNVKGALGALWHRGGSPDEKLLLANALLVHCNGADGKAENVPAPDLASLSPDRDAAQDAAASAEAFQLTITHLAGDTATEVLRAPIADFVGDPHSIETTATGQTTITLRVRGDDVVKVVPVAAGAPFESIRFTVERPGTDAPLNVVRELWHAENTAGPDRALPGDRHDFVVLPCRVNQPVRDKEEERLADLHRDENDETGPYLNLLEYAVKADGVMQRLERELDVTAIYEQPRILIWSTIGRGPTMPMPVTAIDLRLDETGFIGAPGDAYHASQIRGLIAAGLEHHFLVDRTGQPGTSAYDVFCRMADSLPDSIDRRFQTATGTLQGLMGNGRDATATFAARRTETDADPVAAVRVTLADDGGLRVSGGPVRESVRESLGAGPDGRVDASFGSVADAVTAVESVLAGADITPPLTPDFVLDASLDTGRGPLLVTGARVSLKWGDENAAVSQHITVTRCDKQQLSYEFFVRTGLRSARGTRTISSAAMQTARVHNPQYQNGETKLETATSFVISREVAAALKRGEAVEFALQGSYSEHDDPRAPRPIEWTGTIRGMGAGECTVVINGKPTTVAVIKAQLEGGDEGSMPMSNELSIVDDPHWPVGMAGRISDVRTAVRVRVVDENGVGIGGATVRLAYQAAHDIITRPDGRCEVEPTPPGVDLTTVPLRILQPNAVPERETDEVQLDLSAVGVDEQEIKLTRRRASFVWISPATAAQLDKLDISAQARRHARAELEHDRLLIMPAPPVATAICDVYGFYSFNPATGHAVGITEDGLHGGAMIDWGRYRDAAKSAGSHAGDVAKDPYSATASPLHVMRGVNTSMWVFAAYRLEDANVDAVLNRMVADMDFWEAQTNMFEHIESAAGSDVRGKVGEKINEGLPGADSAAAKMAFKLGYLGATMFMEHRMGGDQ